MNKATIYNLYSLIRQGHRWQYQNATATAMRPCAYFLPMQWGALIVAAALVVFKNNSINRELISSLFNFIGIIVGLLIAVMVIANDKIISFNIFEKRKSTSETESQANFQLQVKIWNSIRQFATLIAYSILLAVPVITLLIASMLFNLDIDVIESFNGCASWASGLRIVLVVIFRVTMLYFLLDFVLMTIYAISAFFRQMYIIGGMSHDLAKFKPESVKPESDTIKADFKTEQRATRHITFVLIALILLYYALKLLKL